MPLHHLPSWVPSAPQHLLATSSRQNLARKEKITDPPPIQKPSLPTHTAFCDICSHSVPARACVLSCFICVRLFATPWAVAHQPPLSMGFSRQEYWSGSLFSPPGDLPNPAIQHTSLLSPALAAGSLPPGSLVVAIYIEPPRWHSGKESTCQTGSNKAGLIPGSGRSPVEGNGYPLQYSCLGDPLDRGAWRATVHGVAKESHMTEQLRAVTWGILG